MSISPVSVVLEQFKFRFFSFILFFLIWLLLFFNWSNSEEIETLGKISSMLLLIVSINMILRSFIMKNVIALVIFGFVTLYAIVPKYYFFDYIRISIHQTDFSGVTLFKATMVFALFMILVSLFTKIPPESKLCKVLCKDSSLVYWCNIILSVLILIVGKSGENIFDSGGYYQTLQGGEVSFINEYVLVFFLLAFAFSGRNRKKILLLYIVIGLYCIKNLLFGNRIETVMALILLLIIDFQFRISFKKMLVIFVIGTWFMTIFVSIRQNPLILLSDDWSSIFLFSGHSEKREILGTNEGDVFYASERMFILMERGFLTSIQRIESSFYFLSSSIIPFSFLPPEANLSNYQADKFSTGGGGLAPIFIFVFFSFPGVIFIAYVFSRSFSFLCSERVSIGYCYFVLFLSTMPRWFAYYPVQIIKLCLYGAIFYLLFSTINRKIELRSSKLIIYKK